MKLEHLWLFLGFVGVNGAGVWYTIVTVIGNTERIAACDLRTQRYLLLIRQIVVTFKR